MKTHRIVALITAAMLILACILTGCAGNKVDRQQTCETAQAAYEAYQSTLPLREPTQEEIIAAAGAGVFLKMQCGWTSPKSRSQTPAVDRNGVLVLSHP